jgi:rhodanese-related sulfurtransferase
MVNEISVAMLREKLAHNEDIFLLDVRQPDESAAFNIGGQLIPLGELLQRLNEIPRDKPIVIYCRSGQRSGVAVEMLKQHGFNDVKNLIGGVLAWQA